MPNTPPSKPAPSPTSAPTKSYHHAEAEYTPMPPRAKLLVAHCFASFVICSLDRINLSVAIIPMAQLFGWSAARQGLIQSIFFLGYMLTAVAGGHLSDRHGGRLVLAIGVAVWSLCVALVSPAAPYTPVLLVVRVLLGTGEGVAMPAMNAIVAHAVPPAFRARSLAFIYSGMYVGSIAGLLITPPLLRVAGYPAVFYASAAAGLLWVTLFLCTTRADPSAPPPTCLPPDSIATSAHLLPSSAGDRVVVAADMASTPGLAQILREPVMWAIIVAHICCTWGYFVLVAWMPTYLYSRFALDVASSAWLSALPWLSMFVFANVGGVLTDLLQQRGVSVTRARKTAQAIGFAGPALFLIILTRTAALVPQVVCLAAALSSSAFSQSGVYATHQDIGPHIAGTLLGISNTFASVPGLVGVYVTGVVLDATDQNWNAVFGMAICFYLVGLVVYSTTASSRRIW